MRKRKLLVGVCALAGGVACFCMLWYWVIHIENVDGYWTEFHTDSFVHRIALVMGVPAFILLIYGCVLIASEARAGCRFQSSRQARPENPQGTDSSHPEPPPSPPPP